MNKLLLIILILMLSACGCEYDNMIFYDKKGNAYLIESYMNHYDIIKLNGINKK